MIFSSMVFIWIFLPILLIVYFLARGKLRNYILLLFSLFFYTWGEPKYIVLMIVSIIINYLFGLLINCTKNSKLRTLALVLAILANIGLIGYFKYYNFLAENINKLFGNYVLQIKYVALPIGISFYTFQILSYIIDLYRNEIKVQKNIFKLALYISFFPQLIAGPIIKYHDIEEQIDNRKESLELFVSGIKRFTYGLGKKVILANSLALIADAVFDTDILTISTGIAWLGTICYSLQIYFDFSGYSDMAIGLGRMFGFDFMENFNLPYISSSITEFWRRWHISLSTWFKEYLYIPLGGNRKGKIRTYINLWVVFLVTGIWHGASWNFIFWGLLHGFFIFIERIKLKSILDKFKILGHIYTLFVINLTWIFFRVSNIEQGFKFIKQLFTFNPNTKNVLVTIINNKLIIVIVVAILLSGIAQVLFEKIDKKNKIKKVYKDYIEPISIFCILIISIIMLVSETYNPFIYYRF